jgi:hypothetical protein
MTLRKNIMPELTMERHYLFGCGPQAALRYAVPYRLGDRGAQHRRQMAGRLLLPHAHRR